MKRRHDKHSTGYDMDGIRTQQRLIETISSVYHQSGFEYIEEVLN